jgi:CRP/FNR family transcriptional regulator, cyclic AMP receptor protein
MSLTDLFGYAAAVLVLITFSMKTMVPLRIAGIVSNIFFIAYGYLSGATPVLILHLILLPLNTLRLYQILQLIRDVEKASKSEQEPNLDWMHAIAAERYMLPGDMLFHKGDKADRMFYIVSGSFRIVELGIELKHGQVLGELGLLSRKHQRTQSVECSQEGLLLEITYDRVKQLYFQSPKFGFFFLRIASQRLLDNIERLEEEVDRYRKGEPVTAKEPKSSA